MLASILMAHLALASDPSVVVLSPEEAAAAAAAANAPEPSWYGWQVLVLDGGTAGLLALTAAVGPRSGPPGVGLLVACLGLSVFGGPYVHAQHGRTPQALIDVALRVLIPVATYALAAATGALGSGWSQLTNAPYALAVGFAIASAVDAFGLAWEPPPARASLSWAPFISSARGAPVAGMDVRF